MFFEQAPGGHNSGKDPFTEGTTFGERLPEGALEGLLDVNKPQSEGAGKEDSAANDNEPENPDVHDKAA